jgi:hypothetical protein
MRPPYREHLQRRCRRQTVQGPVHPAEQLLPAVRTPLSWALNSIQPDQPHAAATIQAMYIREEACGSRRS